MAGHLGDPAAIPTLRTALAKEKREVPRAAFLAALQQLGDDISSDLGPGSLLAEARAGLRAKLPPALGWFGFDQLPTLQWTDGTPVDPQLPRWWVVLANKVKDPDGSGLFDLYLGRLQPDAAAALGRFVLTSWVAQDVRHPSEEESRAHAATEGQRRHTSAQDLLRRYRGNERATWVQQRAAIPVEQHVREVFAEHQSLYLGSAAANRGLLALTTRMPGIELANAVQAYIRNHGARRAQVDALMHTLFANGQPAAVQLLLSVSRRFKQASVQATAARLVEALAEQRGWTPEELADRTIPTAGFDADALLRLDFGSREFIGRATPLGTIELSTAEGATIKSLPGARAADDEELVAAREEATDHLPQRAQGGAHPADRPALRGDVRGSYLDGLGLAGVPARAPPGRAVGQPAGLDRRPGVAAAAVQAHRGRRPDRHRRRTGGAAGRFAGRPCSPGERRRRGFRRVAPAPGRLRGATLFEQFGNPLPAIDRTATQLTDLKGHLTDTFSFRGLAGKRGYQRGAAEDGAWFVEYTKPFASAGLTAVQEFTGSYLPEENLTCATVGLSFRGPRNRPVALSGVPDVLLAECYADYAALAALGPFDPEWEKKAGL